MDSIPVTELSETELDEIFGGELSVICAQTLDAPCPACAQS
jgi:hypothetical protein